MSRTILAAMVMAAAMLPSVAMAQDYQSLSESAGGGRQPHRWGIGLQIGGLSQTEDDDAIGSDNEGNAFAITADWYVTRRLALTGGLYAEHTGMLTQYDASGLGPRKYWMAGLQAGAKFYFFPTKWIFQPYVGGSLYANVLNLGHNRGTFDFRTNENYSPLMHVSYDVQCPALSLAPQIGFDLRLVSNVSLTFAADYRWGTYGKSRVDARYTEGPQASTSVSMANPMSRMTYSMGLKLDFPMRVINWSRTQNTLLRLLGIWIGSR